MTPETLKKFVFLVFSVPCVLLFLAGALSAIETGEIKGRVVDESGQGLTGVEITARSPSLLGTRAVVSTPGGDFHFPLLPVGNYTLEFRLDGFNPVIQQNVIVLLGRTTFLIAVMVPSEIREEVIVVAEAPLIDKTSTDTSYHLTRDELARLPAQDRTVVDVIKFTPGVTGVRFNTRRGVPEEGKPSFRGEGEEGTNWIVDGLSISGVRLRNPGMHINFDSIDEIQVISDAFSPEFGSAYGGIVNMVTRSGSNDFSGEFSLVFMDRSLQAGREPQLAAASKPDRFSNYNGFFNLGGPIVRDRLWFFISNNLFLDTEETNDQSVGYFDIPGGRKTTRNNNLFTKFSYALTSNHVLSLTSIFHKSLGQKGGIGVPDLYEENRFSDLIFRLNYKGILSPTSYIEAGLGHVRRDSDIEPMDGDLGPAQYYIEDLALNINNSYGNVIDNQKRLDFNVKLTKHVATETFGRHEFSLGFESYSFSSEFEVDFTGKDEDRFPGNGFDSGTKCNFGSWREGGWTPTFLFEYGDFNLVNSSRGIGLYFKDKVTWGRFAFMVGIRSQTQLCLDHEGGKLWSWGLDDFLSPRLSLAFDITGDGKNVFKVGWGKFSDLITTMPLGILTSGAGLAFRTYRWNGPADPSRENLHNPSFWQFEHEQKTQPFEIADSIKPNFLTRFVVEYNRRLGRDWAFTARYVRSDAENLLEVLGIFDPVTVYRYLFDNFEHKRRNYRGVEFELNGKLGSWLFLRASYCHSAARGTNPGQIETGSWVQEEGNTPYLGFFGNHIYIPDIPDLKELKNYVDWALGGLGGRGIGDEGWYGKLPYSVDHNVKVNAVVFAPYGMVLTCAFEWISGYYWEKMGYVPFFGAFLSFPEGRGSQKSPAHGYFDMGLEKEIPLRFAGLSGRTALSFRLDVFNLFDSQRPVSFVKQDIPLFGQVWARQQPRQARIMVKLKW